MVRGPELGSVHGPEEVPLDGVPVAGHQVQERGPQQGEVGVQTT